MAMVQSFQFETLSLDPKGQIADRHTQQANCHQELLAEGVTLGMVALEEGKFLMGTSEGELGSKPSQKPQHSVTIAPFYLGRYPITQAQWLAIALLPKINRTLPREPSNFAGERRPVEQITWQEAVECCDRLAQLTGKPYRLPTEAEWEYACRAGTTTPFHFGETISTDYANYSGVDWDYLGKVVSRGAYGEGSLGCDRRETTAVDELENANPWGLSDLHGNVREWCLDIWHPNYLGAPTDGSAWLVGGDITQRVVRGGSWSTGPQKCRSAFRSKFTVDAGFYDIGLRVAMSVTEE
jgi:formylglycine-generating enzyme required for sulfatase activity